MMKRYCDLPPLSQKREGRTVLCHPFPSVQKERTISYGGNQNWLPEKRLQRSGCGLVACTDLLLYLHRYHNCCWSPLFQGSALSQEPLPAAAYHALCQRLEQRFFPILPGFGITGWLLMLGLNRYFFSYRVPLRASWGVPPDNLWEGIQTMLSLDLPVILSIGPNFPFFWQHHTLPFYLEEPDGGFRSAGQVCAHYVTVTGVKGEQLRVSSWGRELCLLKKEYSAYRTLYSRFGVSSILRLSPMKGWK